MKRIVLAAIAAIICISGFAQNNENQAQLDLPEVYRDKNVVFWKLDNHTWIGSGNRVSSETLYLIEGEDKAVLLDAGTHIPKLDKIVINCGVGDAKDNSKALDAVLADLTLISGQKAGFLPQDLLSKKHEWYHQCP